MYEQQILSPEKEKTRLSPNSYDLAKVGMNNWSEQDPSRAERRKMAMM